MNRTAIVLLVLCALLACERPAPPPDPEPVVVRDPEPDVDSDNLLNLAYGTAVVSRDGELNLDNSAVHAIDGLPASVWVSSPGSPQDAIVYSLLAPARVTRVGITPARGDEVPRRVRFESSLDGKKWTELATIEPQNSEDRQLVGVKETVARYIRVQPIEEQKYYSRARGFHVIGGEVEPPQTPPFSGCWTINGVPAHIVQDGARLTGVIETNPPTYLDGGTDNRVGMVLWIQEPMFGYAAITRTPDGTRITGLKFYEEIDSRTVGDAWFGERCAERSSPPTHEGGGLKPALRLAKRYPLYGLAFDRNERLIEPLSRATMEILTSAPPPFRLVAREFNFNTPEENRRHAAARLRALRAALQARGVDLSRIQFIAAGSDWDGPPIGSALQRVLASRVDIIPAP